MLSPAKSSIRRPEWQDLAPRQMHPPDWRAQGQGPRPLSKQNPKPSVVRGSMRTGPCLVVFFFFLINSYFIYLFIFGCVGSLFLCEGFL